MHLRITRLRPVLGLAGVALSLVMVLPPTAGDAGHNAVLQAMQFVIFAAATPALLAVAWPAALASPSRLLRMPPPPTLVWTLTLVPYLVLVIGWRVPAVVAAQAGSAALTVLEMVTMVAGGYLLWAALTRGIWGGHPLPHPLRAAMAAVAMWTTWVIAYITGMSVTGLTHAQAGAISQQVAVAVMWAAPAICFVPVVYVEAMHWLGDHHRAGAQPERLSGDPAWPEVSGPLPPPRGWNR